MDLIVSILLILGSLLAGAVSPGPSFLLVAKTAMGHSRQNGVAAAMGMGAGSVLFSALALMGLSVVFTRIPVLYFSLKITGGAYLICLAYQIWTGAGKGVVLSGKHTRRPPTPAGSFFTGLGTQLSNPKTALVYAGIFAALLPAKPPPLIYFILPPLIFTVEAGWYTFVALMLSSAMPRAAYLSGKSLFDRIAAAAMAGLGLKLISDSSV